MKQTYIIAIIAFFLGTALFGILKSVSMIKRNLDLATTVSRLSNELEVTKTSLKGAQSSLGEVYMKNAKLESQVDELKTRYREKKDEADRYYQKAQSLSIKLRETLEINNKLVMSNRGSSDRFVRLQLENEELKNKYTTIKGLKDAIRELKINQRLASRKQASRRPVAVAVKKELVNKEQEKILSLPELKTLPRAKDVEIGNGGFFVKDGKTTFQRIVNVKMVLEDAAILGE